MMNKQLREYSPQVGDTIKDRYYQIGWVKIVGRKWITTEYPWKEGDRQPEGCRRKEKWGLTGHRLELIEVSNKEAENE